MSSSDKSLKNDKLEVQTADDFLKIAHEFKLGKLPTESPNPRSLNLSSEAQNDVAAAIETIKDIDRNVFRVMTDKLNHPEFNQLKEAVKKTLDSGFNIYLCGCGATGRLSLVLETIWRVTYNDQQNLKERVISFMAGGDVALINSVEKFEDFPEYGARQLMDLNFRDGDLLISTTEGGETPFVIGATLKASEVSGNKPFILYCNPDDVLCEVATRSREMIENKNIFKINLSTGPMALTGSTRMQATTILMYYVGLAMFFCNEKTTDKAKSELNKTFNLIEELDFSFLKDFIVKESDIYKKGDYLLYETDSYLGISILTDTTERSPTFSLYPFENINDEIKNPSLSYLFFKEETDGKKSWNKLLLRDPRPFHWPEVTDKTSAQRLYGFDFSSNLLTLRSKYLKGNHHHFKIYFIESENKITFELDGLKKEIHFDNLSLLSVHTVLKVMLNNLSTIIMGRMNRYEANLMTWVRASNNKLIDRAVRYASVLLKKDNIEVSYEDLVRECFRLKEILPRDQALVLELVKEIKKRA